MSSPIGAVVVTMRAGDVKVSTVVSAVSVVASDTVGVTDLQAGGNDDETSGGDHQIDGIDGDGRIDRLPPSQHRRCGCLVERVVDDDGAAGIEAARRQHLFEESNVAAGIGADEQVAIEHR